MKKRKLLGESVADALRQEILRKLHPGDQLAPITNLAQRFDVSTAIVSQALTILTRERLIERHQGSGSFVSERLPKQHVAVLMESDFSWPGMSHFHLRAAQQLRLFLHNHQKPSRLYVGLRSPMELDEDPMCPDLIEDILDNRIAGLVVVQGVPRPERDQILNERSIPVVGPLPVFAAGAGVDYRDLLRQGIRRLVEAGRRRIAVMQWGVEDTREVAGLLVECGVSVNPRWVRLGANPNVPGGGWEEFRDIWTADSIKPDGLLVCDDILFRDTIPAIQEVGARIPEDLLVVSHAVKDSGIVSPFPVQCMEYDPDECAQALGELLLKLIAGERVESPRRYLTFRWVQSTDLRPPRLVQAAPLQSREAPP